MPCGATSKQADAVVIDVFTAAFNGRPGITRDTRYSTLTGGLGISRTTLDLIYDNVMVRMRQQFNCTPDDARDPSVVYDIKDVGGFADAIEAQLGIAPAPGPVVVHGAGAGAPRAPAAAVATALDGAQLATLARQAVAAALHAAAEAKKAAAVLTGAAAEFRTLTKSAGAPVKKSSRKTAPRKKKSPKAK